jgi:hydrogenase maturation protein HypF
MRESASKTRTQRRLAIAVRGVVQGVGFRPFVYNAARTMGLVGWVRNEADRVHIEAQGDTAAVDAFLTALREELPSQASIEAIDIHEIECRGDEGESFAIHASGVDAAPRPTIPADLATCAACLEEIHSPLQRRHGYPFTNCTRCGPRWSIITRLPYDRSRTSMAEFTMCPDCAREYGDPGDRRFHAQPIACPHCGPELRLLDVSGGELARRDEALRGAVQAILDGRIVALKGLGGFQLIVDATDDETVVRLRERKRRPAKPLAVMLASLDAARRCCEVSDGEAQALASSQSPIVLLRRLSGDATVAESVAPGNPWLGVMLPYTPLHHLLVDRVGQPVVCTSGNLSEEPMATTTAEAIARLGTIADVILTHNRPIVRPVDDSIVQVGDDGPQLLRRARGYAPLPIELGVDGPTMLAMGGHLKNAVALQLGSQVVMSSHVGDLDSVESLDVHRRAVRDLVAFFDVTPERIACDLHPDYASTRFAEELAAEWSAPLVRVQHHHAHVASCMAEHRLTGPVLGFAWDGTGYGTDGTVWGGEALCCEGAGFSRVAHLRTFALPGGDRAVREPRRSALGALYEIMPHRAAEHVGDWFTATELDAMLTMLARSVRSPKTSSMGRLFDAVAALCGLGTGHGWGTGPFFGEKTCFARKASTENMDLSPSTPRESSSPQGGQSHFRGDSATQRRNVQSAAKIGTVPCISFEGQAAMALQFAADPDHRDAYPIPLVGGSPGMADWGPMLDAVVADRRSGVPVGWISARLHNGLAALAVAIARHAGCSQVVLSGGCFQNTLLTRRVRKGLLKSGFNVYTHHEVPPGDGGIALGQAWVAGQTTKE